MTTERYVAVDNVCAWPNLTHLDDGTVLAAIYNRPVHGRWHGDVECWASTDDGRLWVRRSTAAPGEPPGNRMNVAAGRDRAGTCFVVASGWSPVLEPGDPGEGFQFQERTVLPALVCRSEDGGHTWSQGGTVALPDSTAPPPIPFGDVVAGPDGLLATTMYSWQDRQNNTSHFYASEDGGRTWAPRSVIGADDYNETDLLWLGESRWLAACRTVRAAHLALFRSEDNGASWQAAGPLTLPRQHPGHLLRLADDRILLVYGIRNPGLYGVGARLSADEGRTWDVPHLLVNFGDATDGGYPSSVQCADGTIVTAYYANRVAAHRRYHMGVVRWRAEE